MKYTPQMEKLMRMGIRQQLQNAYPNRQINEEDVENAFALRKEIMIRDFDQWAMTAFDLKQPGVAKMLEEYYPELLERITNMIEQDIEIQRFDKYQKVFFPMNYDDLVMKWARERGWIKTMEESRRRTCWGPPGATARRCCRQGGFRAGYTPDLSPMFNAQTANISSEHNRPYGRNDVDFSKGNPFGAMLMDQQGTRGPALPTAWPYADQNLLPRVVNPNNRVGKDFTTSDQREALNQVRQEGTVAGMETTITTEATLGEQIEARWGRFLDLLEPEAKEPGRHINAEAELIKARDDGVFEKLPQEYASAVRSLFYGSGPELREKLWLYIELFVELTSE
eukprot:tig00000248_g21840.t1